jgi:hypothetical protein
MRPRWVALATAPVIINLDDFWYGCPGGRGPACRLRRPVKE